MLTKDNLVGKKVGDIIDSETKILTKFKEGYDVKEAVFKEGNTFIESDKDMIVISDYWNHLVICGIRDKMVALFNVYDLENAFLNPKRGIVTAVGHETIHTYWFDEGDYEEQYTR